MTRTSNDELGRRRFQLRKEQAVEEAIEKIRHSSAVNWPDLCGSDCMLLRKILGELWGRLERKKWEKYTFSTLTHQDIRDLLALSAGMTEHTLSGPSVEKMDAILSQKQ
ncbi:MAG: hypothetical protein WCC86_01455 [Methanoregula sp.]|uniref:hypothetical protein n=1 Tax=Methanoregula sp. TaxID=2052170 RepID=UPI003BAEE1A6